MNIAQVNAIKKAIVYGSYAEVLPQNKNERQGIPNEATHRWIVFVRPFDDKCLSPFVKSVIFEIHHSFKDPRREVFQPPYCLIEYGWGEFEINITINFREESGEGPINLIHPLQLFHDVPTARSNDKRQDKGQKKPVISERFEELIFFSPTPAFKTMLETHIRVTAHPYNEYMVQFAKSQFLFYESVKLRQLDEMRATVQQQHQNILHQMWLLQSEYNIAKAVQDYITIEHRGVVPNVAELHANAQPLTYEDAMKQYENTANGNPS